MWAAEHSQLEHGNCLVVWIQGFKVNWIENNFIFVLRFCSSEMFKYNWAILKLDHWKFSLGHLQNTLPYFPDNTGGNLLKEDYCKIKIFSSNHTSNSASFGIKNIDFFSNSTKILWVIKIDSEVDSQMINWMFKTEVKA
jgi:hypothetical protein